MENRDPLELAQIIVSDGYINFKSNQVFYNTSGIYKFSNENITDYFHHLQNKEKVLSVIGSGGQIINNILAGSRYFDCFDISIFPEYYLHLQLASILSLSREEYLDYYFSEDREVLFSDELYGKISIKLHGKYREFWDTLYMFEDGIDIYNSLLFKYDMFLMKNVLHNNPYLQENNYEKLKYILQTESIKINPYVADITKLRFDSSYDLINLSNILTYYFKNPLEYVEFFNNNFNLNENGEIISYFFRMNNDNQKRMNDILYPNGYIEDIEDGKVLVYKKR